MRRTGILLIVVAAFAAASMAGTTHALMPICSRWTSPSYDVAMTAYPELSAHIQVVKEQGTVPWYTDNSDLPALENVLATLASCGPGTKIPLVVYGIPHKDCEAGFSNRGSNENLDDYKAFINRLAAQFPTQHMIYIIEPDAVSLISKGGCGVELGYSEYLQYALETLSANAMAELYLDVGYWSLATDAEAQALAAVYNQVRPSNGALRGLALNTANHQTTVEMLALCDAFAGLTGYSDLQCVIDTSRNYRGPTASNEWCNARDRGMGMPPTMHTKEARAAYYLWIKPPGESDGECTGQSADSLAGPVAGSFFKDLFVMLWENGYFAAEDADSMIVSEVPEEKTIVVPAEPLTVCSTPLGGSCGSRDAATCCPSGSYCQAWDSFYYQCIETPSQCSTQLTDTDYTGYDLKTVYLSHPSQCCDECARTDGCRAYSFVNNNPGQSACYLKDGVGAATSAIGVVAGLLN